MAAPAGWEARLPITTNPASIPTTMPDGGVSVFATDFEFVEGGDNDEGDIRTFVDGLAADYSDLVVTQADGETTVDYGVRQFSQTGGSRELNLGLGAASLSSAVGTDFYLHRGCTGGPFENRAGVVPTASGFQGMWPLEAQNSGAATGAVIYDDWTANANDGADYVSATGKTGQVARGQEFDANDYIHVGDVAALEDMADLTIMAWINHGGLAVKNRVIAGKSYLMYRLQLASTQAAQIFINGIGTVSGAPVASGSYSHIAATYQSATNTVLLYVNAGAPTVGVGDGNPIGVNAHPFRIARDDTKYYLGDYIDEVQVHDAIRSADWITTYYNMTSDNDTFWTVGAEEAVGGGAYYYDHITRRIRGLI